MGGIRCPPTALRGHLPGTKRPHGSTALYPITGRLAGREHEALGSRYGMWLRLRDSLDRMILWPRLTAQSDSCSPSGR